MVTLASAQPGDFALDIGGIGESFQQGRQGAQQEREAAELQKLQQQIFQPGSSRDQVSAALLRMNQIDPQAGQFALKVFESGDKAQIAQALEETKRRGAKAQAIRSIKDFKAQKLALMDDASETGLTGGDPTESLRLASLNNQDELNLELDKDLLIAEAFGTVFKERQQFEEIRDDQGNIVGQRDVQTRKVISDPRAVTPADPVATFEAVLDDKGNIVGQRNVLTKEVKTDPRAVKAQQDTTLVRNLQAAGVDLNTPEGQSILLEAIRKPAIKIDINKGADFKIPPGFMLDPTDSTQLIPIPGGPKDNLKGENAAKMQMLRTARRAFPGVLDLVFDEMVLDKKTGRFDGNIDRTNLISAASPIPWGEGRELKVRMEFGIQAITRLETGAAMPAEEVENTRTRFMPSFFDSFKIAKLKLDMYQDFIGGTLKLLDPNGRFDTARFDSVFQLRLGGGGQAPATQTPAPTTAIQRATQAEQGRKIGRFSVKRKQ